MINSVVTTMPMFVSLFWGAFICMDRKRLNTPKKFLALFMFDAAALYATHCAFYNNEMSILPYTDTIYAFSVLSVYPLFYLYIKSMTGKIVVSAKNFEVLIPAIVTAVLTAAFYLFFPSGIEVLHLCTGVLFAIEVALCLFFGIRKISLYNKSINNYYSNTENKTFDKINLMMTLLVLTSALSMSLNMLGKTFFINSSQLLFIPSVLFSVMLYFIGFAGYSQDFYAEDYYKEVLNDDKSGSQTSQDREAIHSEERLTALRERMNTLVSSEKLFLNPNLKVQDLANALSTNRDYIYKALNMGEKLSFSDFVNRYRVNYAIELRTEYPSISMSELSIKSGFSSESSFYRNFKTITGLTPQKAGDSCSCTNETI